MLNYLRRGFLYERLDVLSSFGNLEREIPDTINQNLNPAFEIRDYQEEAFARFIYCFNEDFPGRENSLHLLFNMATGSGKTLIMAGLILYLYEEGYRNFLFFVNSTNIIEKTKDNFLNPDAPKYLFNKEFYIKGKRIKLTEVENFSGVNEKNINICFTTIQQLHSDMTNEKENAVTYENFADNKIVLLADEAHHMNVSTQSRYQRELFDSWENTVGGIFRSNSDNLLLEFTATHDYENQSMIEKYQNKVLYRYDFTNFRNDLFSKDVVLVHSDLDLQARILQALILNQYKQYIAAKYSIQLKPVILFKAQKTIRQSRENKANFHKLINELTGDQIDRIRSSDVEIVQRAFRFFDKENISSEQLAQHLRSDFRERYCLSVNDESEKATYQILVNTLEHKDNPIRAIFAVQKLNEGWDVLNLFDIVRCYETRDTRFNRPGSTTVSEAQLIGRGARYFPFTISENANEFDLLVNSDDKFRRKFDENLNHELRVLEELHYHSINDSRYISEIRIALRDEGIIDQAAEPRELKLKDEFKQSELYQKGVIWLNKQVPRDNQHVKSFDDLAKLSVKEKHHEHTIHGGTGSTVKIMEDSDIEVTQNTDSKVVWMRDIEPNIIQSAIACNPFFTFASLKQYFPRLTSMRNFMTSEDFLGGLAIIFKGNLYQLDDNHEEKLRACCAVLGKIESDIRKQITEYEGTKQFHEKRINEIFIDKILKLNAKNPRIDEDPETRNIIRESSWFAFNDFYGTSEERTFVELMNRWIREAEATYKDIYLLRNERHFAIYNFSDGRAFEPDFVLFLCKQNGELLNYQLFIEPKGRHLIKHEQWKEDFLKEIRVDRSSKVLTENHKYRVIGVDRFYNEQRERAFEEVLNAALVENIEV